MDIAAEGVSGGEEGEGLGDGTMVRELRLGAVGEGLAQGDADLELQMIAAVDACAVVCIREDAFGVCDGLV